VRILLFTGKGGVGKTTLAAATGAALAARGRKTLVVSTDPAHSLGDAFGHTLGAEPSEVDALLSAVQIDSRTLVDTSWHRLRAELQSALSGAGLDTLDAEELTVLPGVDELLALTEVRRLAEEGPWETIVVDCGPTAETLRLLALPEAAGGYLERLFPAHRRAVRGLLAGLAGGPRSNRAEAGRRWDRTAEALDLLAADLAGLRALLAAPGTGIRLVLTPERVVAAETRRTLTGLALHGLRVEGLVANRLVPAPSDGTGAAIAWLRDRAAEQAAVLAELGGLGLPVRTVAYRAAEPTGLAALQELGAALWGRDDPAADVGPGAPLLSVHRTAGDSRSMDSEFELVLRLPEAAAGPLELARIGDDELAVTAAGTRRLVALPAALRRCTVARARLVGDDLRVAFRPDPALWMR
jgi:arsenite-transporting ATPase